MTTNRSSSVVVPTGVAARKERTAPWSAAAGANGKAAGATGHADDRYTVTGVMRNLLS